MIKCMFFSGLGCFLGVYGFLGNSSGFFAKAFPAPNFETPAPIRCGGFLVLDNAFRNEGTTIDVLITRM